MAYILGQHVQLVIGATNGIWKRFRSAENDPRHGSEQNISNSTELLLGIWLQRDWIVVDPLESDVRLGRAGGSIDSTRFSRNFTIHE